MGVKLGAGSELEVVALLVAELAIERESEAVLVAGSGLLCPGLGVVVDTKAPLLKIKLLPTLQAGSSTLHISCPEGEIRLKLSPELLRRAEGSSTVTKLSGVMGAAEKE